MPNTARLSHIITNSDLFSLMSCSLYGCTREIFYRVRNSMCSFRWNYFRREIRCLLKHFGSNTAFKTQFLSFLTNIRWALNRTVLLWLQRNIISGISTKKLSPPMCVWNCCCDFCFQSNFFPWYPPGICEKINLIETTISLLIDEYFCHKITFYKFWTCFSISRWFFE